jgi:hypothetical protein
MIRHANGLPQHSLRRRPKHGIIHSHGSFRLAHSIS